MVCSGFGFNNTESFSDDRGVLFWVLFGIVLSLTFIIIGWIICKRFLNRRLKASMEANDISDRINSVVSSYVALKDQKK